MMTFIWSCLVILSAAMIVIIIRLVKGPTVADRIVALDALGIGLVSTAALVSILVDTLFFSEIILLIAIVAFIGTVAFSKFIEKGAIFKVDDDC